MTTPDVPAVIGWMWSAAWAASYYPQLYRCAVTGMGGSGLDFDFLVLQWVAYVFGSVWACGLMADGHTNAHYFERYAYTVDARDVFVNAHNLLCTSVLLFGALFWWTAPEQQSRPVVPHGASPLLHQTQRQGITWFSITVGLYGISSAIAVAAQHVLMPASYRTTLVYAYLLAVQFFCQFVKFLPQIKSQAEAHSTRGFHPLFVWFDLAGCVFGLTRQFWGGGTSVQANWPDVVVLLALLTCDVIFVLQFPWYAPPALSTDPYGHVQSSAKARGTGGYAKFNSAESDTSDGSLQPHPNGYGKPSGVSSGRAHLQPQQRTFTGAQFSGPSTPNPSARVRLQHLQSLRGPAATADASEVDLHVGLLTDDRLADGPGAAAAAAVGRGPNRIVIAGGPAGGSLSGARPGTGSVSHRSGGSVAGPVAATPSSVSLFGGTPGGGVGPLRRQTSNESLRSGSDSATPKPDATVRSLVNVALDSV